MIGVSVVSVVRVKVMIKMRARVIVRVRRLLAN